MNNNNYYYLISSLPFLKLDIHEIPNELSFLKSAEQNISQKDFLYLKKVDLFRLELNCNIPEPLHSWYQWEGSLRNQLVRLRCQRLGLATQKYIHEVKDCFFNEEIASTAVKETNPLLAERYLNKKRWKFLDELDSRYYFDLNKLIIYYLKIQLLKTNSRYSYKEGLTNYKKILSSETTS